MRRIDVNISDELFNPNFAKFYKDDSMYLHGWGGAGSGKSYNAAYKIILRTLNEPRHKFLLLRKVGRTIRQSQYALIKTLIQTNSLSPLFEFRDTDMTITCVNNNKILTSGLDDVDKLKSIDGITGTWIEEATELSKNDFLQLDLRLRSTVKTYEQHIFTYNPLLKSGSRWLREMFHLNVYPKTHKYWSNYKDNKFLSTDYIERLENLINIDKTFYKVYVLGQWAQMQGLIYNEYGTVKELPDTNSETIYGIDFGFNHPTVVTAVKLVGDELFIDEIIYKSGMTNSDLNREMNLANLNKRNVYYCDSAEPKTIEELHRYGWNVKPAIKGANSVFEGIRFAHQFKMFITEHSINTINEINEYKWQEDKDGNSIDKPVKFRDDAMDAFRMALYSHYSGRGSNSKYDPVKRNNSRIKLSLTAGF